MSMPQPPACPGGQLYTIARGDTLFLLARRFNTTVEALRAANPQITNPNVLVVGQKICLPPGTVPVPTPPPGGLPEPPDCPGGHIHTVASGETLYTIAQRYRLPLPRLIAANPQLVDPNVLAVGQKICVPGVPAPPPPPVPPPPECPGGTIYTVKAGDTIFSVAQAHGVSVERLLRANPQVTNPNLILVGQKLCIPKREG